MNSIKVCEYSRSRSFHDDLILQDQASGERSQDHWSSGLFISLQHKYQINIDGTVAAYRFPYLLAGNSLVLKQDSPYYEYFYKDLKPFEHYVPIKRDLSDIMEKIQWAKDNEEKVNEL